MLEILEGQTLEAEKLVSFRGSISQAELEEIGKKLEAVVNQAGAKRVGNPITATYGVDGNTMDIEILLPVDKKVDVTNKYTYKEKIKIVNAVAAKYTGNPSGLQEACNELNNYIVEKKLMPVTVGYNVPKKIDPLNMEQSEMEVYVGISQNIL